MNFSRIYSWASFCGVLVLTEEVLEICAFKIRQIESNKKSYYFFNLNHFC